MLAAQADHASQPGANAVAIKCANTSSVVTADAVAIKRADTVAIKRANKGADTVAIDRAIGVAVDVAERLTEHESFDFSQRVAVGFDVCAQHEPNGDPERLAICDSFSEPQRVTVGVADYEAFSGAQCLAFGVAQREPVACAQREPERVAFRLAQREPERKPIPQSVGKPFTPDHAPQRESNKDPKYLALASAECEPVKEPELESERLAEHGTERQSIGDPIAVADRRDHGHVCGQVQADGRHRGELQRAAAPTHR